MNHIPAGFFHPQRSCKKPANGETASRLIPIITWKQKVPTQQGKSILG